jgi:hypothetical protein
LLGTQISTKTCANCCKIFLALCTIGYARVWELSGWTKLDGKLLFLLLSFVRCCNPAMFNVVLFFFLLCTFVDLVCFLSF